MKKIIPQNYFRILLSILSLIVLFTLVSCLSTEDEEVFEDIEMTPSNEDLKTGSLESNSAKSPGTVITIKAKVNGKFLSSENGTKWMTTNRNSAGNWEKFTVVDAGGGYIALKAYDGRYVCSEKDGAQPLIANRDGIGGDWEKFKFVTSGSYTGIISKKGKYVCAESYGNSNTIANRNSIGDWEKFTVTVVGSSSGGGNNSPYDVLGLDRWKITLPKDQSGNGKADEVYYNSNDNDYSGDAALTSYSDEFFYVNSSGNVVFECPADDNLPKTSTGTSNTRTELREMPYQSGNDDGWDAGGSTVREMSFRVRVLQTSSTRKLAFAQIHDYGQSNWDDLIRIQIQSDNANATVGDNGKIYIIGDMAEGLSSEGVSGQSSNDRTILSNYTLGDWLDIKVTYSNDTIRIYLGGSLKQTYTGADCPSNYFKAGIYNQSMSSSSSGTGIVEFQNLSVSSNF